VPFFCIGCFKNIDFFFLWNEDEKIQAICIWVLYKVSRIKGLFAFLKKFLLPEQWSIENKKKNTSNHPLLFSVQQGQNPITRVFWKPLISVIVLIIVPSLIYPAYVHTYTYIIFKFYKALSIMVLLYYWDNLKPF